MGELKRKRKKPITADEARALTNFEFNEKEYINNKIEEGLMRIEQWAQHGWREVNLDIWHKDSRIISRIRAYFEELGYEVEPSLFGLKIKW